MKKIFYLIFFGFLLQSCAVLNSHWGANPLSNKKAYVELKIDDIEFLGETEISYEYSRYLIFMTRLISINGVRPDNGNKHYVNLYTGTFFNRKMQRALHKAYVEFPEADYFDMKNSNTETHRMFLGRKTKLTATVKAYKYRYPQK